MRISQPLVEIRFQNGRIVPLRVVAGRQKSGEMAQVGTEMGRYGPGLRPGIARSRVGRAQATARAHRGRDRVDHARAAAGRGARPPPRSRAPNAMSPSKRVATGRSDRASPSCALSARSRHSTFEHRASVATTTSVVCSPGPSGGSGNAADVGGRGRAGDDRAVVVDHVADRVDDRERADGRVADAHRRAAEPTRRHRDARRATSRPSRRCPRRRDRARARRPRPRPQPRAAPSAAVGCTPPDATRSKIAAVGTIGTGPGARPEAATARREVRHHAVGGREPERRATGEHDRVDVLDELRRLEQRGLARRGRATAHLTRTGRRLRAAGRRSRRCPRA